jgi:hypothetical protein
MKYTTIITVLAGSLLIAGCNRENSGNHAAAQTNAASSATPAAAPALSAWQQSDQARAISLFVAADWNAQPLFASDSPLSLSESQFVALSDRERQAKSATMITHLDSLRQLATAVSRAAHDAAAKGDKAAAKKDLVALLACGLALDSQTYSLLVQQVGKAIKNKAVTDMTDLGL